MTRRKDEVRVSMTFCVGDAYLIIAALRHPRAIPEANSRGDYQHIDRLSLNAFWHPGSTVQVVELGYKRELSIFGTDGGKAFLPFLIYINTTWDGRYKLEQGAAL